jgi:hypothetical protein
VTERRIPIRRVRLEPAPQHGAAQDCRWGVTSRGGRELRASGLDCGCGLPLLTRIPKAAARSRNPIRCRAKLDLGRSQAHRPPREPLAPGTRRIGIRRSGVRHRLRFPGSLSQLPPASASRSCRSGWGSQPFGLRRQSAAATFLLPTTPGWLSANPKGIPAQSPGLRACELPWEGAQNGLNPSGVACIRSTARTQPRLGWCPLAGVTQGSLCLATLGLATESRRDSRSFRPRLVGKGKAATALFGVAAGPKAVSSLRSATAVQNTLSGEKLDHRPVAGAASPADEIRPALHSADEPTAGWLGTGLPAREQNCPALVGLRAC